jgi:hypothetical protein
MPWDPSTGERRKSYCPDCAKQQRGQPTTVTFAHDVRITSYKCSVCGQEWLVYQPNPARVTDDGR